MMNVVAKIIASLILLLSIAACGEEAQPYSPSFSDRQPGTPRIYSFGVLPVHNPKLLLERYGPILNYLNAHLKDTKFRLEASRNYEEFERKLCAGKFDFAFGNAYEVSLALRRGYHIFGKMGDDRHFRGVFLVRRDGEVDKLEDLKGKKIAYPAETSVAASMLPLYFLQTNGIDVHKDVKNLYVGSQESSIMNVFLGNVAAGTAAERAWLAFQRDHPEQAAQLTEKWYTETLIHNGLLAHPEVPPTLARKVGRLLAGMHETAEGQQMLQKISLSRFETASDATYDKALVFLERYSATVSPLVR